MAESFYLLALDISLACTGYAVMEVSEEGLNLITSGIIPTNSKNGTGERLVQIQHKLEQLKNNYQPKVVIAERGFVKNSISSKQIAKAFGVAQMVFSELEIIEISPMTIKKAVAGSGRASKELVSEAVKTIYPKIIGNLFDVTDAIALAITWYRNGEKK